MQNIIDIAGKLYILYRDGSLELFDNWLVGYNLRLAEEQKRLTKRAVDVANEFCNCVDPHFDIVESCSECGKPPRH